VSAGSAAKTEQTGIHRTLNANQRTGVLKERVARFLPGHSFVRRAMIIPTYVIGGYGRCITCLDCGLSSCHPEDVRQRYCHRCPEFHDDKEKKARTHERSAESPAPRDPLPTGPDGTLPFRVEWPANARFPAEWRVPPPEVAHFPLYPGPERSRRRLEAIF
jgi:hypothetical protein